MSDNVNVKTEFPKILSDQYRVDMGPWLTEKQIQKEKRADFIQKLNEYLEMDQYPGRSMLQELFENNLGLLNDKNINSRLFTKIEKDLYRVANSELDWDKFKIETKNLLIFLSKNDY